MATNHTPAPWIVKHTRTSKVNSHIILCKEDHNSIAHVIRQCDDEENEANARLIAAAPELLEALKEVDRILYHYLDDVHPTMQKTRAAIQKAEASS